MRYLPINLDIRGATVLVVGGGRVAERKCRALLAAGGRITVIAPELCAALAQLHSRGMIRHLARPYADGDLNGALLVYAASHDRIVNRAVATAAARLGILADITDAPAEGNVTSPASCTQGDLVFAVSTGGASPTLARRICRELQNRYGREYADTLQLMGKIREKLLTRKGGAEYNEKLFAALLDHDPASLFRDGDSAQLNMLLQGIFGEGFSLAELGLSEQEPA